MSSLFSSARSCDSERSASPGPQHGHIARIRKCPAFAGIHVAMALIVTTAAFYLSGRLLQWLLRAPKLRSG